MDLLSLISVLVVLCAGFSYLNVRFLKLPPSIGLMLISLVCSLLIIIGSKISSGFYNEIVTVVRNINFSQTLLNVMLGFLLFAGSLQINLNELFRQRNAVLSFSTLSVALSIFFFGSIMWGIFQLFNYPINFMYCLWFGSLVSPTDPIAVIGILKKTNMPKEIETTIKAESLFNDGIGVVFFVTIGQIINLGAENLSAQNILMLFGREVLGGITLGLILGYGMYFLVRKIDHYQTEVLLSLALVMGCGELAGFLHVSGPLAVIVLGLILGNKLSKTTMSEISLDYHTKFWELIDDFMNAILFVMIGLQIVIISFNSLFIAIGVLAIFLLLVSRYLSLSIPIFFLKNNKLFNYRTALIMTWGGLRGGLSVALTLSLPESPYKPAIVSITYIIVVFSILVQGLTTEKLVGKLYK